VETAGDIGGRTYLSDLNIPRPNWIYGNDYSGIAPERFFAILSSLNLRFEDFTFIDFGSGKGRALLLASEFPFKRIIGVEFSPELHAIAQRDIERYNSAGQKCKSIESVCSDFTMRTSPRFMDACWAQPIFYNGQPKTKNTSSTYTKGARQWKILGVPYRCRKLIDNRIRIAVFRRGFGTEG
jgi:SAM-dependent methyltransferase